MREGSGRIGTGGIRIQIEANPKLENRNSKLENRSSKNGNLGGRREVAPPCSILGRRVGVQGGVA
jgi:hypothetical protein